MAKTRSIASVTISFNGKDVLPTQFDALRRQSHPIAEIVVVDNASSDGTVSMIRTRYPEITILSLSMNTGVGGGYATGLLYTAIQKKYDWVWLLDQDSVPHEDALERLLEGLNFVATERENVGILASLAVHPETKTVYPGLVWRNGWRRAPDPTCFPSLFVDAVISSGSLVRREAVAQAGLPRADFFMDFVDLEHCLRVRRHGYKIVMVRDSVLDHVIGRPRNIRLLLGTRKWRDHVPWREYYKARNEVFTIWNYYPGWRPKYSVIHRLLMHAVGIILFGNAKRACLRMMYLGIVDGMSGKLGIRFPINNEIM
jgi:GT2 family glycosyltransferase